MALPGWTWAASQAGNDMREGWTAGVQRWWQPRRHWPGNLLSYEAVASASSQRRCTRSRRTLPKNNRDKTKGPLKCATFIKFHAKHDLQSAHHRVVYLCPSLTTMPSVMKSTSPPRIWIIKKDTGSPRRLSFWQQLKISPWPEQSENSPMTDCPHNMAFVVVCFFHPTWLKIKENKHYSFLKYSRKVTSLPPACSFSSTSGPSAPCWFSMASSSLSRRRGVPLGQQGISCSLYMRNSTARGTGSWGCTENTLFIYFCDFKWRNRFIFNKFQSLGLISVVR